MSDPTPEPRQLADVPVFNCHVYLSPPDEQGLISARVASLSEAIAQGRNEREALRNVVAKFKEIVGGFLTRGEAIPWLPEPLERKANETQRFVPVHF